MPRDDSQPHLLFVAFDEQEFVKALNLSDVPRSKAVRIREVHQASAFDARGGRHLYVLPDAFSRWRWSDERELRELWSARGGTFVEVPEAVMMGKEIAPWEPFKIVHGKQPSPAFLEFMQQLMSGVFDRNAIPRELCEKLVERGPFDSHAQSWLTSNS